MLRERVRKVAAFTALSCMVTMAGENIVLAKTAGVERAAAVSLKRFDTEKAAYLGFGRLYPLVAQGAEDGMYYFTTTEKKSYYQIKALLPEDTACHVELYDESGSSLAAQADLENMAYERFALEPSSVYFMKATGQNGASGEIVVSEITDDHADTAEGASAAALNKEYSVTTECPTDVDYLKFSTDDKDTSYTLSIDPASGSTGEYEVLDEAGNLIEGCSGTTEQDAKFSKKLPVEHNKTYYIKISSAETGRQVLVSVKQTVNKYKITYHLDGGTNHKENKTSYTATQNLTLKNPTKKGYLFDGWYTASNFSKKISSIKGSDKSNYNLYAKWKKVTAGTVSVKSFSSTSPGKAKLVFGAVSGTKGYQVSLKRAKTGTVKNQDVTKTSVAYSGLVQGEKYSVQVRSFSIDSCGNRVYSAYSNTKTVTVKKKEAKKPAKKKNTKKKK